MSEDPRAGMLAEPSMLANIPRLMAAYYTRQPDPAVPGERVAFGTSGHRGSALRGAFNEAHVLAITQAICLYREREQIDGPLFLGIDTHALSESAFASALEVLAANRVDVMIDDGNGYTPTPVISHAILTHNRGRASRLADGIVVTPSHNPPEDGGVKYNPPNGGPAAARVTDWSRTGRTHCLPTGSRGCGASRSSGRAAPRPRVATTTWAATSPTSRASWTWKWSGAEGSGSVSTRSGAPASGTGAASPSVTSCP